MNYCGTQAPLWLHLDGRPLPQEQQEATNLTACSSWLLSPAPVADEADAVAAADCCAMKYPVSVRNCSAFLVYHLQPPAACNMAYCAQLAATGK